MTINIIKMYKEVKGKKKDQMLTQDNDIDYSSVHGYYYFSIIHVHLATHVEGFIDSGHQDKRS